MMSNPRKTPAWRKLAALAGAATLAFSLAACSNGGGSTGGGTDSPATPDGGSASGDPYRVGVLLGLTGAYASLGVPEQQAIELYFDQVNADGGINGRPVELVIADSASDESTAVNQLRKLTVEDNVHAILGPSSSGEAIALRTFTQDLQIPTIALASSSAIVEPPEEANYIFKQYTGTNESLLVQLQYAKEQGWDKVALLYVNNGYGQDPANRIQGVADQVGLTLTGSEAFDAEATDVTAQLSRLGTGNPDVVLVWATMPMNAVVARSADSINFEPMLFNSPGAGSHAYIETGGSAVEGTLLQGSVVLAPESLNESDAQFEATNRLVTDYQSRFNETAGQYSANGWDGATILHNAIEKAMDHDPADVQGTRDAIRDSIEGNTNGLVAVNAIYTFTPEFHGSLSLDGLAVLRVTDGKFEVMVTY